MRTPVRRWAATFLTLLGAASAEAADAPGWKVPAYDDGAGTTLTPFVELQGAYFAQSGSWYGRSRANLGRRSTDWVEGVASLGADGSLALGDFGSLYGGLTAFGLPDGFERKEVILT